jgi:hypothetical protein
LEKPRFCGIVGTAVPGMAYRDRACSPINDA